MTTRTIFDQLKLLIVNGYILIRLGYLSKRPLDKRWTTVAGLTEVEAREHLEVRGWNVGVRLRPIDFVIDVDPRNFPEGRDSFEELKKRCGLDFEECPRVNTPGGGFHLYLSIPEGEVVSRSLKDLPGIDFLSFGAQVVASGSVGPKGKLYEWDSLGGNFPAPQVPESLLLLIRKGSSGGKGRLGGKKLSRAEWTPEQLEEALNGLDVCEFREHDDWFRLMAAAHEATRGQGESVFNAWSTSDPEYRNAASKNQTRWRSLKAGRPDNIGAGTLRKILLEHGVTDVPGLPVTGSDGKPLILDPQDPMPSARKFVEHHYLVDGIQALHYQAGVFYRYRRQEGVYEEVDENTIKAAIYLFLEVSECITKDGLQPFRPTRNKAGNVLESLKAVCHLPSSPPAPCWLESSQLDPLDIIAEL